MEGKFFVTNSNLLPSNGEIFYCRNFFSKNQSDVIFNQLNNQIEWRHEAIKIFGKDIMQPRLTAWYGDAGINYSYSGITMKALDWTETLIRVKTKVEEESGHKFSSALLNLYRDGSDSMGWHRDNEKELGENPIIASVSFGATRKFQLGKYKEKSDLISLNLEH